jgi:hypothetical protein
MKKVIMLAAMLVVLSCDVIIVEPQYDVRTQLVGSYWVEEYSKTYDVYTGYSIWLSKGGGQSSIYLDNFYDADISVRGEVSNNKVFIPWQVVDGYEIEGVGTLYGTTLSLSYRVRDTYYNTLTDFCESEAKRSR